ncbi:hypothetical protein A2Z00_05600 [Candidatus Gottesmanbacteria bacterium RBG_13_45_10]|uniref:Uncharacterized protein n=1 Tax=Candidatus Gottesmanbacteria bacterium RBG_13_45_10 TaxID=1798370 RepID=A0A1F5ZG05_9BACT|nr:MAG: hypothetical protein A2Z00_05600 [Candidatus Gottesmanbacteria bacterium RBG_13_45_10]
MSGKDRRIKNTQANIFLKGLRSPDWYWSWRDPRVFVLKKELLHYKHHQVVSFFSNIYRFGGKLENCYLFTGVFFISDYHNNLKYEKDNEFHFSLYKLSIWYIIYPINVYYIKMSNTSLD